MAQKRLGEYQVKNSEKIRKQLHSKRNNMKTIQEVVIEAAGAMVFEDAQSTPMIEVTISSKEDSSNSYSIRLPKLFLEEFARLAVENYKTLNV
jgi:hypothetical protein